MSTFLGMNAKDWMTTLLSGAGTIFLGWLSIAVWGYFNRKKIEPPPIVRGMRASKKTGSTPVARKLRTVRTRDPKPKPAARPPVVDITLDSVLKAYEREPLLSRRNVASRYKGIRVRWRLSVISITSGPFGGDAKVSVGAVERFRVGGGGVSAEVDPSDYPGLALIGEDHPIEIEGTILDIELGGSIKLGDARLYFELPGERANQRVAGAAWAQMPAR